jgi:hypothetical protein
MPDLDELAVRALHLVETSAGFDLQEAVTFVQIVEHRANYPHP